MTSLIALAVVLLALVGVVALITRHSRPRLNKKYFASHWQRVEKEPNHMAAIIAADNLVDEAMKRMNLRGNTMGERLNNSGAFIKDINATWSAHKVRNRLVHEPDTVVSDSQYRQALRQFKRALKDLGAL